MEQFKAYLADIRRDTGRQLPLAAALVAIGAVLEGIGIIAILPLAALITGNADTETGRWVLSAMTEMGLATELSRAIALTTGFIALLALRNIVVWLRDTRLFLLGLGYVDGWRIRMLRAISKADWSVVSGLRRSDFEHAITNDVSRLSSGTDQMLRAAASIALSAVQLGIVAVLSPMLLLLVFVMLGVSLLFTLPLLRKASALGKKLTHSGRRIYGVLGDFMSSQKLARLNNAEAEFVERFDASIREVRTHQTVFFSSQTAARGWFQLAAGAVVIAALLVGFFILKTPLSVLAVTLLVLARLVGPIQMIAQTGQSLANTLPAFTALRELHAELSRSVTPEPQRDADVPQLIGPASLDIRNVSFTYPGTSEAILHDVSLTIAPGEMVALSGPSGAGKTTMLDLISGLLSPDSGEVVADGAPLLDERSRRDWRTQLAYLPQDPFLFDASLRENLLWSAKSPDEAQIAAALEIAGASDLIDLTRGGLNIRAGDRGQALSGGERQRICLARALLRQPRLLILDEATNALDAALEQQILERLRNMRSEFSILLVTHRNETLRYADRVVRLDQGRMAAG